MKRQKSDEKKYKTKVQTYERLVLIWELNYQLYVMSSGFVTEQEVVEARQRRQEEWEKVRSADQPIGKI